MANLERAGWLGLALASCCALVLGLGALEGRGPARPRPSAVAQEREHALVRGRAVLAERGGSTPSEAALAPRRPLAATQVRREPCAAEADSRAGLAALAGRITRGGRSVQAHLRFELGWNRGLELDTAGDGAFARRALGPGFQQVTVTVAGEPPCSRSLFLEPARETSLQLDFGAPREQLVRVLDPEGRALSGAKVELDGQTTVTDAAGGARLVSVGSGAPELVVRAPRCAWFACALERSAAELPEFTGSEFTVQLDRACTLELSLPALAGADDALVYLLPRDPGRLAGRPPRPATPWYLASPLHLSPGASVRLENLPAGELEVRAFHPAARVATERVVLDPGHPLALTLRASTLALMHGASTLAPGEPERDTVRGLLVGLGGLPRLQPLDPALTPRRSTALAGASATDE